MRVHSRAPGAGVRRPPWVRHRGRPRSGATERAFSGPGPGPRHRAFGLSRRRERATSVESRSTNPPRLEVERWVSMDAAQKSHRPDLWMVAAGLAAGRVGADLRIGAVRCDAGGSRTVSLVLRPEMKTEKRGQGGGVRLHAWSPPVHASPKAPDLGGAGGAQGAARSGSPGASGLAVFGKWRLLRQAGSPRPVRMAKSRVGMLAAGGSP